MRFRAKTTSQPPEIENFSASNFTEARILFLCRLNSHLKPSFRCELITLKLLSLVGHLYRLILLVNFSF